MGRGPSRAWEPSSLSDCGDDRKEGERVRRIVLLALAALATAIAVPSLALAHEDAQGPPCSDIVGGDGFYTADGTVTVIINLDRPSCEQVSYQAFAVAADGTVHELTLVSSTADGSVIFQKNVDSSTVCVYAMTSIGGGGHVADRAPSLEGQCVLLTRGSGGGFTGFS